MVSIILPTYNGEKYIRESIQSIIDQTYQDWELIVIDDCSTDNTNRIVAEFESKDERIKLYKNKKNLRLPASLNRGFELSKGDFLTWTSDDNLYNPNAIEKLVEALSSDEKYGLVFSRMEFIDADGGTNNLSMDVKDENEIYYHNIVGASFMYTRKVYECIGDYNVQKFLMEDYDYWLRVANSFSIKYLNEILYKYRLHQGSLTETRNRQMLEEKIKLLKEQLKLPGLDKEIYRLINKELAEACFSLERYQEMKEYFTAVKKAGVGTGDIRRAVRISYIIGPELSNLMKKILKKKSNRR